jgi:hypothetical protein
MPYKINWLIDQQVLFTHMWGENSIQDYVAFFRESEALYDQGNGQVHTIVDATHTQATPNVLELKRALPKTPHPNLGWGLGIVDNPIARFVINIASTSSNQKVRQFNTLEAALTFLREHESDLNWDQMRPEVLTLIETDVTR